MFFMKKTAITLLFFLTGLNLIYSQEDSRKTIFGVNAGCSLPYAEFAARTMTSYAGFASPGMNMEIDLMGYMNRFFGLTTGIGYASFFFRENAYQAEYDRVLAGFGENNVSAGNYQVLTGVLGFILKIPETRHIEVLIVGRMGIAMSVHPDLSVTNSKIGEINTVSKNSAWSAAANAELKVHYWLTEKYGITLNYSVNATRPNFRDDTGIGKSFFLPVRYMNINAGFVMNLQSANR
jgi:hypothetical protein